MIFMKFPSVHPEESASPPLSLFHRECPKFSTSIFDVRDGRKKMLLTFQDYGKDHLRNMVTAKAAALACTAFSHEVPTAAVL